MADCKYLKGCPFFEGTMEGMDAMSEVFKKKFCKGEGEKCARHKVRTALGPGTCPPDLFPNQLDRAEKILAAKSA